MERCKSWKTSRLRCVAPLVRIESRNYAKLELSVDPESLLGGQGRLELDRAAGVASRRVHTEHAPIWRAAYEGRATGRDPPRSGLALSER